MHFRNYRTDILGQNMCRFCTVEVIQMAAGCLHVAKATPLIFMISWIHIFMKSVSYVWVNSTYIYMTHVNFKCFSNNITRYINYLKFHCKIFSLFFYFRCCVQSIHASPNIAIKTLRNFFTIRSASLLILHKIASLMLYVEEITDRASRDITFINDAVFVKCFGMETTLLPKWAWIKSSFIIVNP
jgi:hypothetical protein